MKPALPVPTRSTRSSRSTRSVRRLAPGLVLALLLGAGLSACGAEDGSTAAADPTPAATPAADLLEVEDPWVRGTTGSKDPSMTAAFMALDNTGDAEITVTGASAAVAGRTELHEMAAVDGEMVMRRIEGGLVLAPGRGQLLQPGGSHVMLMDLTEELLPGDEVEVVLELSDGSTLPVSAPIKEFTEEAGHYHGDHDHGDEGDHDHGDEGDHDHGDHDHGDDQS